MEAFASGVLVLYRHRSLRKRLQKALAPPINVIVLDGSTKALHPALLFAFRHGQTTMDGIGQVLKVIGIHNDGV